MMNALPTNNEMMLLKQGLIRNACDVSDVVSDLDLDMKTLEQEYPTPMEKTNYSNGSGVPEVSTVARNLRVFIYRR
jgi:hypothetical protein